MEKLKDQDTGVLCNERTRLEEDGKPEDLKDSMNVEEGPETNEPSKSSATEEDDATANEGPGRSTGNPQGMMETGLAVDCDISPGTVAHAALSIACSMMNETRRTNTGSSDSDTVSSRPLLKQFRTLLEQDYTNTFKTTEHDRETYSSKGKSVDVGDKNGQRKTSHTSKPEDQDMTKKRESNSHDTCKGVEMKKTVNAKSAPEVNKAGNDQDSLMDLREGPKVILHLLAQCLSTSDNIEKPNSKQLDEGTLPVDANECYRSSSGIATHSRFQDDNMNSKMSAEDCTVESASEKGGKENATGENIESSPDESPGPSGLRTNMSGETLDVLLARAAADACQSGNPLHRLRAVLKRVEPPPSDEVRPLNVDEAGGDRYEYFWSNLGLLRRYQDPLRRTVSGRSFSTFLTPEDFNPLPNNSTTSAISNPAAALAAAANALDEDDYRDFLSWQNYDELKKEDLTDDDDSDSENRSSEDSSPASQELRSEVLDKAPSIMQSQDNSFHNIYRVDSNENNIDNSLRGVRKRLRIFFSHLFGHES